jgi:hypothetical protein
MLGPGLDGISLIFAVKKALKPHLKVKFGGLG